MAFSEHRKYVTSGISHSIHFQDREQACMVKAQHATQGWQNYGCAAHLHLLLEIQDD